MDIVDDFEIGFKVLFFRRKLIKRLIIKNIYIDLQFIKNFNTFIENLDIHIELIFENVEVNHSNILDSKISSVNNDSSKSIRKEYESISIY